MARRRYGRRHRRGGFKIPVISLAILGGQWLLAASQSGGSAMSLAPVGNFASYYTGYNFDTQKWQPERLLVGYGPFFAKKIAMKVARPSIGGLGRMLPISLS